MELLRECLRYGKIVLDERKELEGLQVRKAVFDYKGKRFRFIMVNGVLVDKRTL